MVRAMWPTPQGARCPREVLEVGAESCAGFAEVIHHHLIGVVSFEAASCEAFSFEVASFEAASFEALSFEVASFALEALSFEVASFEAASFEGASFEAASRWWCLHYHCVEEELIKTQWAHEMLQKKQKAFPKIPTVILLTKTGDCAHMRKSCPSLWRSESTIQNVPVCTHCLKMGPA